MTRPASEWIEELQRRDAEVRGVLEKYPDQLVSREQLKELSGMLSLVNWIIFALVGWLAFAWLAPVVNGDSRPTWSMWLIFGPLFGTLFGGLGGAIGWTLCAHWLGSFLFDRQDKPSTAEWWRRFISANWDRFRG